MYLHLHSYSYGYALDMQMHNIRNKPCFSGKNVVTLQ